MQELIIRQANIKDIESMALLLGELGYPTTPGALIKRFHKFTLNSSYGVFVTEINKEIAGFIAWSTSYLFVSDATRYHIEALVVSNKYRFQGVGKKLMACLEEIAKANGPSIIDLTSGVRREKDGSHKFYRSLGYENDGPMAKLYLRKAL